jgi:hypothetical protein
MCEIQLEYRTGIKFLTKEANGPKVIHQRMIIVYGNEGPSLFQIRFVRSSVSTAETSVTKNTSVGRINETLPKAKQLQPRVRHHGPQKPLLRKNRFTVMVATVLVSTGTIVQRALVPTAASPTRSVPSPYTPWYHD